MTFRVSKYSGRSRQYFNSRCYSEVYQLYTLILYASGYAGSSAVEPADEPPGTMFDS